MRNALLPTLIHELARDLPLPCCFPTRCGAGAGAGTPVGGLHAQAGSEDELADGGGEATQEGVKGLSLYTVLAYVRSPAFAASSKATPLYKATTG